MDRHRLKLAALATVLGAALVVGCTPPPSESAPTTNETKTETKTSSNPAPTTVASTETTTLLVDGMT